MLMPAKWKTMMHPWPIFLLALALLGPGACTPDKQAQQEQTKQIQDLKKDIKALEEKVARLETGQQKILQLLQKPGAPLHPAAPPAAAVPLLPSQEPLSVSQLLKNKERYQGARVTVRGMPGPVLVHHQTLMLKAPEGMVEVYFGALQDQQTVNRLTSTNLDKALTVTGIVNVPRGGGNLKINAEAVEF